MELPSGYLYLAPRPRRAEVFYAYGWHAARPRKKPHKTLVRHHTSERHQTTQDRLMPFKICKTCVKQVRFVDLSLLELPLFVIRPDLAFRCCAVPPLLVQDAIAIS